MEDYIAYMPRKRSTIELDPRTKVLFMALVTTLMFYVYENILYVTVLASIPCFLLIINKQYKTALIYGGLFVLAIIACIIRDTVYLPQVINAILVLLIALVMRLFPTFMLGYYIIKSTKVNEFVTAMKKWHVSDKIIIPLTVVFRFIPTIQEEHHSITDAMRIREIQFGTKKSFRNPLMFMEYRIIPLMISIVKIGEELSAAALTRGLGSPIKRTNIARVGFGINDLIILIISIGLIVWMFL